MSDEEIVREDVGVPGDYAAEDGYNDENGLNECPVCGRLYSGNGGYVGPVYLTSGRRYENYLDTDPADGPFFCPRCWEAVDANVRREENRGLAEFAGAGGGA